MDRVEGPNFIQHLWPRRKAEDRWQAAAQNADAQVEPRNERCVESRWRVGQSSGKVPANK